MKSQLFVADEHGRIQQNFKKAKAPKTGPSYGQWSGNRPEMLRLPGGPMLQFDLSVLTLADFRTMRDHYQVNASLALLSFMMHQMDWSIKCESKKIANSIEENLRSVWTKLMRGIGQAYWAGYSPMAIEYENNLNDREVQINKFKDLVPEECKVKWKQIKGAMLPGSRIPQRLYEYDGISQLGSPQAIPIDNTLWYPLMMENGDMYGRKLLRPAFPSWFYSIIIHMFANRYLQRFGEPTPVGRAPFDEEVDDGEGGTTSGKEIMEAALGNLRSGNAVYLPSDRDPSSTGAGSSDFDYTLEFLESQMRGADFERYLDRLDEEISLSIFTPALLLRTSDVGSYNLGVQHLQTYMWLLNALAGDLKEYLDKFVVRRLHDYNFGPNAPRAEWVPRALGRENVETMRAIVTEMVRADKVKPNIEEMGQAVGLDFTEIQTLTTPPPAPEVPGAPGAKPATDPRQGRPERPTSSGPRGVNQTRATGRKIAARAASQIDHAFRAGYFDPTFSPTMGFQRQFRGALIDDGASPEWATYECERLYSDMSAWWRELVKLPADTFEGPEAVVQMFQQVLDHKVDELLEI